MAIKAQNLGIVVDEATAEVPLDADIAAVSSALIKQLGGDSRSDFEFATTLGKGSTKDTVKVIVERWTRTDNQQEQEPVVEDTTAPQASVLLGGIT